MQTVRSLAPPGILPRVVSLLLCSLASLVGLAISREVQAADRYLRPNILGYATSDPKVARLLSKTNQNGAAVRLIRWPEGTIVWNGAAGPTRGAWGAFGFTHAVDFSSFATSGLFRLEVVSSGEVSLPFVIGTPAQGGINYGSLGRSLLSFFHYQRCGGTGPELHQPCHLLDAAHIIGGPNNGAPVNVTGGWHDAGDYIKFMTTEAFSVELLLLAEEIRPGYAGDQNGNTQSDLLDESLIGIRHLLKLRYAPGKFLHQVQDEADHDQGWRLPEDDALAPNRPAFYGAGKNHLGRYAAAMARAARAFQILNVPLSDSCRTAAIDAYSTAASAPNIAGSPFYLDSEWRDKMGLGAIELYLTTGTASYLNDAKSYSDQVGPGYWFGWDTVNGLLNALLAPSYPAARARLEEDLTQFQGESNAHPFGMCATEVWGTNLVVAGEASLMLLYERVTGGSTYTTTAFMQRDFLLGANPWGICFVGSVGSTSPHDLHHQVAQLANGGSLPGCLTEGPAPASEISGQGIVLEDPDEYAEFQASRGTYHDDVANYVTNEPTIVENALGVLLGSLFAARGTSPADSPSDGPGLLAAQLVALPNPMRFETQIVFSGRAAPDRAITIVDVEGRCLRHLTLRRATTGDLRAPWDGLNDDGERVAPGVYWAIAGGSPTRIVCVR